MKKQFFALLVAVLTVVTFGAFAQTDTTGTGGGTTLPVDIGAVAFASFTVMALIVVPVTGWIKTTLKLTGATQLLSWIVAVAVAYAGYALKLGIMADAGPITTALYGFAAGLVSNGIADIGVVQGLLVAIGAKVPKSK